MSSTLDRNDIPLTYREVGMVVFVIDQSTYYRLVGGITNSNWVIFHPGTTVRKLQYQQGDTKVVINGVTDVPTVQCYVTVTDQPSEAPTEVGSVTITRETSTVVSGVRTYPANAVTTDQQSDAIPTNISYVECSLMFRFYPHYQQVIVDIPPMMSGVIIITY